MEEFEPPTYEEYQRATTFARFRYKYGLIVTFACWLCLIFIIIYMIRHAEILGENPLTYGTGEADLLCECWGNTNKQVHFYVNETDMWLAPPINTAIAKPFSDKELQEIFSGN